MHCFAHIAFLIVTNGSNEHNNSIDLIWNTVKYLRFSHFRLLKFISYVEKEMIESKDTLGFRCLYRWNYTYLMLQVTYKFEKTFNKMEEEDEKNVSYFGDVTPQP